MNNGYVRLWRKINENKFLMHDNNAYLVFTKLLTFVNYKTGEYDSGRFVLAELTNLNPNTLYSVLKRLEKHKIINIFSNNKYSTISICNWNEYQGTDNTSSNNPATTRQQPDNTKQELRTKKKEKGAFIPEQLEPEISEFVKMRKANRKAMTERAIELLVKKLDRFYPGDYAMQKLCLDKAIEGGWTTVYELKPSDLTEGQKRFA